MTEETILSVEDFQSFKKWLNFHWDEEIWQEKFEQDFEHFWSVFFIDGLSVSQVVDRFRFIKTKAKTGPISVWFSWIQDRFISYLFVFKGMNIKELQVETQIKESNLSIVLRNFFIDRFPYLEDQINESFQIGNILSSNREITFEKLKDNLHIENNLPVKDEHEVLNTLEVILYDEWESIMTSIQKDLNEKALKLHELTGKMNFYKQIKFLQEVLLLFFIGALIIFAIKSYNVWMEQKTISEINLYEPIFWGGSKNIAFQSKKKEKKKIDYKFEDIDKILEEQNLVLPDFEEERQGVESEVMLTSVDSLPKDFGVADLEQSTYEESRKADFRDRVYGDKKAYRVLLKSEQPENLTPLITLLMQQYDANQASDVAPGTEVPGGRYYNLYVPRTYIKEFLAQLTSLESAQLYVSRTRTRNPPGRNRVFVWIKKI